MLVGLVGLGIASAHGNAGINGNEDDYYMTGYGMMGSGMMGYEMMDFDEMETVWKVFESGTYEDLESLREEYNMPIMYWVQSEEDFQDFKEEYLYSENGTRVGLGCYDYTRR